jgi:hypothetical protein
MSWTASSPTSRIFAQAMLKPLAYGMQAGTSGTGWPTGYSATGLLGDTINLALFNDTVSPDASAAVGSTGYNTGTWVTGNEVTGTNWAAGGQALASKTVSVLVAGSQTTGAAVAFDAADVVVASVTIANAYGDLIYDNTITAGTVAKQGLCFRYYGGAQSVTAGQFSVIMDATGVLKITV